MQELKETVFIDPFTDFGAKKLFGPRSSPESLMDFLNAILKLEKPIVRIDYITNEQVGELRNDRKSVFDIHARDQDGNYIIVEIQRLKKDFFKDRSVFYSTYPVRGQGDKGDWNFELKRTYTICILDFCFDDTHPEQTVHRVKLIDEDTHQVFCDRLMYWYIEMPKFRKKESELITREDKWLFAINNLTKFSEIPLSLADDSIFDKFFMDAKTAHLTELELQAYYASRKAEWDEYAVKETARREGREEGIELGTAQRNTAFVTNLLTNTNLSVEEIAKLVDVPVEFVLQVKNQV